MIPWFRFYNDVVNDPKVQRLPDAQFKAWVNLLCLASRNGGLLPPVQDIAYALRVSEQKVTKLLEQLSELGLFDETETGLKPHNWDGRQYKSDTSTERVKRFRERSEKRSETVSVTAPDTEQSRAESEQTRARGNVSSSVSATARGRILEAFAAANSPNIPDTARVDLWLAQGWDVEIFVPVIAEAVKRKPSISSLSYFENAITEAHAKRNPTPAKIETHAEKETRWRQSLDRLIADGRKWPCRVPPEIPNEFAEGYMTSKLRIVA